MTRATNFGLDSIQATSDLLTARAGIAPFAQFLTQLRIPQKLAGVFEGIRKESVNSASTKDIFASVVRHN